MMAGLEDFYPELKDRNVGVASGERPASGPAASSRRWDPLDTPKSSHSAVPQLLDRPPRLVHYDVSSSPSVDEDPLSDHYAGLGIGAAGLLAQHIASHPFTVLRRQCQVSSDSFRRHRTPLTLVPVMVHLYRLQGISSMWKGLGSALTVRGILLAVEDCTGKFTPWPPQVDSGSSLKMVGQHLLLKAVSMAVVVPFYSASLVESVQSDIASEKPGILDIFKEGLLRMGPQSGSRTLPMWLLIPPTVIHGVAHYIISTIVKTVSGKVMRCRHRARQEQQGAVSKANSVAAPGLAQYHEQVSAVMGLLAADVVLFPVETILHRLHLQGTRTIIDNLDTGKEVVPIITRYEGFLDCFHSIISEEGAAGLFKGFGALVMQYAVHLAIIRLSCVSIREVVRLINSHKETLPPDATPLFTTSQSHDNLQKSNNSSKPNTDLNLPQRRASATGGSTPKVKIQSTLEF